MRQQRSVWNTNNALVACFIALFAVSLCYFPNMGGVGLGLPLNTLTYALLAGMVLLISVRGVSRRGGFITPTAMYFSCGVLLLCLPLAFSPAGDTSTSAWRVAGLLAGWGLYCAWLQRRLNARWRGALVVCLVLMVSVQAAIALLQLFLPAWSWVPMRGSRVFGIFQQPNVLGSFLATGLALTLMLALLPGYVLPSAVWEKGRKATLSLLLLVLTALLVWVQSRTGWLAGALVLLGYWAVWGRRFPRQLVVLGGWMLLGCALGLGVLLAADEGGGLHSHAMSNQARLAMLLDTLKMIAAHPFVGWGYGSFEAAFQQFRISQQPPTAVLEIARHPHNEILLWWLEGGVVALLGMLAIVAGAVRLCVQALAHDRRAFAAGRGDAGEATCLCLALLPMALHSQLEYPFYLSALHWLVFVLLLATVDRLSCRHSRLIGTAGHGLIAVRGGVALLCLAGMVLMLEIFRGGLALTIVERGGLRDMRPLQSMSPLAKWGLQQRRSFDLQTHRLLAYNVSRDDAELDRYAVWAQHYLTTRVDANVYANLIAILRHQQQSAVAERYRSSAALLFPRDRRFYPPTATSKV
ncbi:Wzy polymerase domain-containing protein [Serratia sp. NPDC078593]|uniref:PglL family O-oligosaccharyltransferase n=1 Tax=unclassified Serratia (in: enterobacteria) TaxID=2647522 RepID=UPI0037D5963A